MKNIEPIIPVSDEGLYPIRTVSELSGVNAITLRAWERRYGLFTPKRTPKGHRLYSEKDVQRIQQVLELLAKGVSISRVAKALSQQAIAPENTNLFTNTISHSNSDQLSETQWEKYQELLFSIINNYDIVQLESLHHEILSNYAMEVVSHNLISPVLATLRTHAKKLPSISGNYHFYKIFLLQRMGGLFLKNSIQNEGKKIVLMNVDNRQNDVELLLFAIPLLKHGYQFIILGCDVSFDAIPMTLSEAQADGVLLFADTQSSKILTEDAFHTVLGSLKTPVFIYGQYNELQNQELLNAGLITLCADSQKQISTINKHL